MSTIKRMKRDALMKSKLASKADDNKFNRLRTNVIRGEDRGRSQRLQDKDSGTPMAMSPSETRKIVKDSSQKQLKEKQYLDKINVIDAFKKTFVSDK
jgi:hypothetical protein